MDWSAKVATVITEATSQTASIIEGVADFDNCVSISEDDGKQVDQTVVEIQSNECIFMRLIN